MARPGARPKPVKLRVIDGTHRPTRHGSEKKAKAVADQAAAIFGALAKPPRWLRGESLAAWKQYIAPAGWLDGSKEPAAIAFCELWAEFRFNTKGFPASKHGQLRAYMSELGLTDERNRKGDDGGKGEDDELFD